MDRLRPYGLRDERSSPVTSGIRAISSKALLGCLKKLWVKVSQWRPMEGPEKLQTMKEQLKEYVWDTIGSSENMLVGKDDALEAMVTALKKEINELKGELKMINELKGELKIFKAAIGNGTLASKQKQ
ncbi:hypothetical protein J1N35_033790 [Gossypium stocksii]|uniref:Uncharacterized protein n=1 Tax=Gossypium stocksii TaxID=47602 RepID=A0A9D3UQU3_9ROSI|nr:hypothetical protein J1N35_033790 [Gossypium stocksii]